MEHVQEVDGCAEAEGRLLLATAFETAAVGDLAGGGGPVGAELLRRVRRRTSRQRRARALGPAGAVAALGGAAAVAVTLTATVASAPSAFAAVTAAAAKTSAQGFRVAISINTTEPSAASTLRLQWQVAGRYDPSRGVGEETIVSKGTLSNRPIKVRFIGQDVYVSTPAPTTDSSKPARPSKPWLEAQLWPRRPAKQIVVTPDFASQQTVNPGALLALLKSAGTVTKEGPASGPGWTGTKYGFTVHASGGVSSATGTVYVDSTAQVRRPVTAITLQTGGGHHSTSVEDVTFSDFGAPVSVTAPPASQVSRLKEHVEFVFIGW